MYTAIVSQENKVLFVKDGFDSKYDARVWGGRREIDGYYTIDVHESKPGEALDAAELDRGLS